MSKTLSEDEIITANNQVSLLLNYIIQSYNTDFIQSDNTYFIDTRGIEIYNNDVKLGPFWNNESNIRDYAIKILEGIGYTVNKEFDYRYSTHTIEYLLISWKKTYYNKIQKNDNKTLIKIIELISKDHK